MLSSQGSMKDVRNSEKKQRQKQDAILAKSAFDFEAGRDILRRNMLPRWEQLVLLGCLEPVVEILLQIDEKQMKRWSKLC